jgi:hypothetical protein
MLVLGHLGQGRSCVLDHRLRIAPSSCKLGAKERDRRRHRSHHANLCQHPDLPRPVSLVECAFGLHQETLDRVQAAEEQLPQPLGQAQRWSGSHRLVRESRQPSLQQRALVAAEGLAQVLFDQSRRPRPIPRPQGMVDRLVDQPVLLAPFGGPPVQLRQPRALGPLQPSAEQIGEQVMEAVPAALLVQRDQEQVGALDPLQDVLAIGISSDRAAERAAESLEDGASEQKRPYPLRLTLEHLLAQVVEDVAMGPRERTKEGVGIRSFAQGERGQLQAHRPPLRPALQGREGLRREVQPPHLPQQGRRLLGGVKRRSAARNSASWPAARSRARGSGGSLRLVITT